MANWGNTFDERSRSCKFWGGLLLLLGAGFFISGGKKEERGKIQKEMADGLRSWGELKKENEELYYKCLRELEGS